jgi:hypothetical protein
VVFLCAFEKIGSMPTITFNVEGAISHNIASRTKQKQMFFMVLLTFSRIFVVFQCKNELGITWGN